MASGVISDGRERRNVMGSPRTNLPKPDVDGRHVGRHPIFRDFADRYGFTTCMCRRYRARIKG